MLYHFRLFFLMMRLPPRSTLAYTLFPSPALYRSVPWSRGPVVPWSRGPVVPWSRGPVVPWSRASRYALRSTRAQPMPELPEVETTRAGLAPHLLGRRISAVRLRRPDLRWPIPVNLPMLLNGQRIEAVRRRAKYQIGRASCREWVCRYG